MEFRILGPLEVLESGRTLELGGAKQRTLLAILLLHANEVVSTDRLIDALWEEDAPETGRKALQVYVSGLRKVLGKDRLQTQSPGYRLRVEPGELDLDCFERLAGDGRLAEALALWRGPPLAEFAYQRFAQAEISRLEDRRLALIEERIAVDLEAGRQAALVGELEALVGEHPLRERLREQLMLALYRSGRQAEALEAYQDARGALVEELGIEPGRRLRDLQQAILEQDAGLDVVIAVEDTAAPDESPPADASPALDHHVRAVRKTVTVLHVQIGVGTEGDGDVDPEILRRATTRAFSEVAAAVEAHGGTIETVGDDAVSAVFGLPFVHEDDPVRAVRAADEIEGRLARAPDAFEVRIGIGTGAVVTGGTTDLQLRATGKPFRTSARLAREGTPGEVALDDATRRLVESARREGGRFASPMVGRERERRRLHDAFEQAVGDRSCQLFTLLGAAGVGKSRLVQEFLDELAARALVARGRCLPYGEGITYWPVLEAIKDLAGLDDTASADDAQSRLARLLDDDDASSLLARRVLEVVGLTEATTGVEEGHEAIRGYLEAVAARRPLVVVFDDVHWGEPMFLDLVEHIADWSRGAALLLVCVARPELLDVRSGWAGGKLNATTVLLEPLSDEQCNQLISNLVGESDLAEDVATRIGTSAEGNPLFVEEMLSMLIDDGLLVRDDGRWIATSDLATVPVPPTIQALLAARLDRLAVEQRDAIQSAAVEGKLFHEGWVAQLAPESQRDVLSGHLAALVRKELIRPERPFFAGERAYHFRHLLIRDAAYDSISKESRAELHERHADWLETRAGDRAVELDEILGYHLEQAFRYRTELGRDDETTRAIGRRAAERLGAAGRRAFMRSDAPAGVNLISRAVALLRADDPLRVELVPNVRVVQGMSDLSWADKVLTEAVEAASTTGDRRLAAHALVQRGLLRLFTVTEVTARELLLTAEQAIKVLEELEDEVGLTRAWRLVAQAHYLEGQCAACADASERALAYARRAGDRFEEREVVEWLGIAFILGSTPAAEAEERCRRLLTDATEDRAIELSLVGTLAHLVGIQGRGAEFSDLYARAEAIVSDPLQEWLWHVPVHFAWFAGMRAQPDAAERTLRPDYERLKKMGEASHFSAITTLMAQAVYAQGRYDEAETLAEEAATAARPNDVHTRIVMTSTKAKILARRGDYEAAEGLAREAVGFAQTTDFLNSRGEALLDLAEVLRLAGRPSEAVTPLTEAIATYERKGNSLAAEHARETLAEVTAEADRVQDGGRA
jgi:DNA-binding SARP family transcriptional activator/tetratricopeptide (TPR) repeat protein